MMNQSKTVTDVVVYGFVGTKLDSGTHERRWDRWRPTVALHQHDDLLVKRTVLLCEPRTLKLAEVLVADISSVSPETIVEVRSLAFADPWDFEEVFETMWTFLRDEPFDVERESYLFHISTGSHVQQICSFLLTESRHFPGSLLQSSPGATMRESTIGTYRTIDLDLSRYDRIAQRFSRERADVLSFLKQGIETRNEAFNALMERIEHVVSRSKAPVLLTGPTGAGKTQLARRIYALKKDKRQLAGPFVEVNCATIRGDQAMSALFGHVRGSFTGANRDRSGLLKAADGGLLFLDEIGELGLDEQTMMLRALETKTFLPLGSDREVSSDFQLIAGTNLDLGTAVREGRFRADLLARIDLWSFDLPGLAARPEDIPPNVDFELDRYAAATGDRISFNREARETFLRFAIDPASSWEGNFRDLNAAITRMATLAPSGRITVDEVGVECDRLRMGWRRLSGGGHDGQAQVSVLERYFSADEIEQIDIFDRVQLAGVLDHCQRASSLSDAGRNLFQASRIRRKSVNDADRLRKYLARFGLSWANIRQSGPSAESG